MSRVYTLDEAVAARRRFPVYLVDSVDGITPETGESGGQPQLSKSGAAFVNTTNTLVAVGNGNYYVEFTATELNTQGILQVRFKSANTAEFSMEGQVIDFDLYTALPANLVSMFEGSTEFTVDQVNFTSTTTEFDIETGSGDDPEEWTDASLFWTSGINVGTTVFVVGYSFQNSKVRLVVSLMENVAGGTFIRMGRKA